MRFTCPACQKSYKMQPEHLGPSGGAKIKCPNCQAIVRVQRNDGGDLEAKLASSAAFLPDPASGARPGAAAAVAQASSQPSSQALAASAVQPASQPMRPSAQPAQTVRKTGDASLAAPIWHVAVGKSAQGPMSISQVQALIDRGDISLDALAWRKGMANWAKIGEIAELRGHVRAALSKPAVDPAGLDLSGNAPTVMADIVQVPEVAQESPSDFYKASTLKPGKVETMSAQLPRAQPSLQAAASRPTGQAAQASAAAQTAAAQPAAAARPAAAAPARATGPQVATGAAGQAGRGGAPLPAAGARAGAAEPQHGAQAASFFSSGDSLGEIELDLPDPNKHKPTKEEYQNLLQEFSVMFRLDKRSKRQKVAITVVLSMLLVGVIAFGAILYIQGEKRQALIRDSKTILAVFSLPYNNSVTINLSREAEEEAAKTGTKVDGAPAGTRTTSALANQLRTKIKAARTASGSAVAAARPRPAAVAGGGGMPKALSAEEIRAQEEAYKKVMAAQLGGEKPVAGFGAAASKVSKDTLRGLCAAKMPTLRGCGEKFGAQGFTAEVTIGLNGRVSDVNALVGGSREGDLSSCASGVFKSTNYGLQTETSTFRCEVH